MISYLSHRFCEVSKNIHKVEEWNENIYITIYNYNYNYYYNYNCNYNYNYNYDYNYI